MIRRIKQAAAWYGNLKLPWRAAFLHLMYSSIGGMPLWLSLSIALLYGICTFGVGITLVVMIIVKLSH